MRVDFADAFGAVDWGGSQIPILASEFHVWRYANAGIEIINLDQQSGRKRAIFRKKGQLPSVIAAHVGAIINSFRTALDLTSASVAARNGRSPSRDTHFPFFACFQDFIDPLRGVVRKHWFSQREIEILTNLRPYRGGDDLLCSLHHLDIVRKHERLLSLSADPSRLMVIGTGERPEILISNHQPLEDGTPLFEFAEGASRPEWALDFNVVFNETTLPAVHGQSIFQILGGFQRATEEIISLFAAV